MDDNTFKEQIYGPYIEVWKIIKLLQHCSSISGDWDKYKKELDRYAKEFDGNKFAEDLGMFLLQAAEDIKEANDNEAK